MRLIKFFIALVVLVVASYCAGWFYIVNKITSEINAQYAGKQIHVNGARGGEYYAMFDKVVPTGFPFMIAAKIIGWTEESRSANFAYSKPIITGYNFITQNAFVKYDGEIKAVYKPAANGFGSNLKINDYQIVIDFPLSKKVLNIFAKKTDPFELLNYIGDITISTGKVEAFDLVDGVKFYDKEYEQLNLSFAPSKHYESLADFLSNIPNEYNASYKVKTNVVDQEARRIPVSLFYGFFAYPSGVTANGTAIVKTNSKTFKEIGNDMDLKASFSFNSMSLDIPSCNITYVGNVQSDNLIFKIVNDTKIRIKEGFFDELFRYYGVIHHFLIKFPPAIKIDRELSYIITNKDDFSFKNLENSDYHLNLNLNCAQDKKASQQYINVNDFSLYSEKSGVRLKHESEIKSKVRPLIWTAKGIIYVSNYPSVIESTSGYIYRFGKFKALSEEARKLYVDINKTFFKSISDYPESTSEDLSFEYDINSNDLNNIKIGSVKFANLEELYQLVLFHKLMDKVGIDGDVVEKMKKLIPDLNENSKFIKEILPKITTPNIVEELITKKLDKIVPEEVKDIGNKVGKDFLKKLIK